MSVTGTVKDGVIVLPPGVHLPEGTEVQLTVPEDAATPNVRLVRKDGYSVLVSDRPVNMETVKELLAEFP